MSGMDEPQPVAAHEATAPSARRRGSLPLSGLAGWRRTLRYILARFFATVLMRLLFDIRVEGRERFASEPAIYCFSHLGWTDPLILLAALPLRPRLFFFGPKEEDMSRGGANRLMSWTGTSLPFKPGKGDLLETTRRVQAVFDSGAVLAIAGEGRIHVSESEITPLQEGTAYFALRSRVPIIPVTINGNSWLAFRRRIRVQLGEPIAPEGRPSRETVEVLTVRVWTALRAMVADAPDIPATTGLFGWLTELFNDWGDGTPEALERARQRREAQVPGAGRGGGAAAGR